MTTATQSQQCYAGIVDLAVTIALMESKMLSVRPYRNKHDEENYQLTKQKYLTLGDVLKPKDAF